MCAGTSVGFDHFFFYIKEKWNRWLCSLKKIFIDKNTKLSCNTLTYVFISIIVVILSVSLYRNMKSQYDFHIPFC